MGVGAVPDSVLHLCRSDGILSVHRLGHPLCHATTELIWRKGMLSANMTALRQCLHSTPEVPGKSIAPEKNTDIPLQK